MFIIKLVEIVKENLSCTFQLFEIFPCDAFTQLKKKKKVLFLFSHAVLEFYTVLHFIL